MQLAVASDEQFQIIGERVHHGDPDAMQTARDLVRAVIEFAAGVQHRHDHFGSGPPSFGAEVAAGVGSPRPVKRGSIAVAMGPGATALSRTPRGAASRAADLVSPSTACLLAEYTEAPAPPRLPKVDEMLTMQPWPWSSINRSSC